MALAPLGACSAATAIAVLLPRIIEGMGVDRASGSGPLATVVQDLMSIATYLANASALTWAKTTRER